MLGSLKFATPTAMPVGILGLSMALISVLMELAPPEPTGAAGRVVVKKLLQRSQIVLDLLGLSIAIGEIRQLDRGMCRSSEHHPNGIGQQTERRQVNFRQSVLSSRISIYVSGRVIVVIPGVRTRHAEVYSGDERKAIGAKQ
jgi:hypothetical protein